MFSKIGALNRAIEKAERVRIKRGLPVDIAAGLGEQVQRLEQHLARLIEQTAQAKASGLHGPKGLPVVLDKLKVEAADAVTGLNQAPVFAGKIAAYRQQMNQRAAGERSKATPADAVLSYFRQLEIRTDALRRRQEAAQIHGARNDMRPFEDPIEKSYLECCMTWAPEKEEYLAALEKAPYPIEILPRETVAQGYELIQRALSPEVAQALDYQAIMAEMSDIIYQESLNIIEQPHLQAVTELDPRQRKLEADNEPLQPLTV